MEFHHLSQSEPSAHMRCIELICVLFSASSMSEYSTGFCHRVSSGLSTLVQGLIMFQGLGALTRFHIHLLSMESIELRNMSASTSTAKILKSQGFFPLCHPNCGFRRTYLGIPVGQTINRSVSEPYLLVLPSTR